MGIYGAINAAVSGLSAQSTALENIAGNVANSQTIGYKRLDTTFSDLVSGGGAKQSSQVAGTTFATSRATNSSQGDITDSDVDTYMAINGDGYFVVTTAGGTVVDGEPAFNDTNYYTRAGDFELTDDGYLVNSSGYYLMGFEIDEVTGNASGDNPGVIKIYDTPIPALASTRIDYQASLPVVATSLAGYDAGDPTSWLSPLAIAGGNISAANNADFVSESISGGTITVFNANGTPQDVNVRWAKSVNAAGATEDTWKMYISTGGDVTNSWYEIGSVTYDATGAVSGLTAGAQGTVNGDGNGFTLGALTVNGVTTNGIDLRFGSGSGDLAQYADPDGRASSVSLEQNGYASGEIVGLAIDEAGQIVASYSNSQTRTLYDIPLATFEADHDLRRVNGSGFAETPTSGVPDLTRGGAILSNAVELSNADIASEFSKLIVTQQAYSANSRVISSGDEMLDEALNMVR
ncbi:MAG: flagellar hook-basal body complex protein [Rhodobacteraceae bacterium]|nr:flagellar hook-basal body complex protein [Paracoccaceae bacterium]